MVGNGGSRYVDMYDERVGGGDGVVVLERLYLRRERILS